MITNPLQKKAYDAVSAALPFTIDPAKVTVEPGVSYIKSRLKVHDYAAGLMGAFGSVVEHIGTQRGLPAQTMTLHRRLCGMLLNSLQLHYLNGYCTLLDTWPVGPDNGIYRAKDGRYVTILGLHPHLRDGLLKYFDCANTAQAIQASVEKKTAQQIEDEVAALYLPLGMVRSLDEWLAHPQGAATAKHNMIDFEQEGNARQRQLGRANHRPLEGVRVLELTHLVAGPTIGRLLAEQGADVIKVQPPMGDWVTPLWLDVSWGKRNISLDIKSRSGMSRFQELLATAAIYVQIVLGAVMRHTGAGLAIPDFPAAFGALWPTSDELSHRGVGLHFAHRIGAAVVPALVLSAARALGRLSSASPVFGGFAAVWTGLVFVQILLGALSVWSSKAPPLTAAHLAGGALCWVTGVLATVCLGACRNREKEIFSRGRA